MRVRERVKGTGPHTDGGQAAAPRVAPLPQRNRFLPIAAAVLVIILSVIFILFHRLTVRYKNSVTLESARHLEEINFQIATSAETNIEKDWLLAHTVGTFLEKQDHDYDDAGVLDLLQTIGKTWGAEDITVYTADGSSVCLDGEVEPKDVAAARAATAREKGEYVAIVDSNITYIVAVDTIVTYHDSPVVAVSIVKNMQTFLDDMEFSSFGNTARMYLTDETGRVFSRLSDSGSQPVFNVTALLDCPFVSAFTEEEVASDVLLTAESAAVLITEDEYVVTTAVHTRRDTFRLIYVVPVNVVNATMNSYMTNMVATSLIVLLLFGGCALVVIIFQYRSTRKQFDTVLRSRERMFDLLVKNSRTAFGLFELNSIPTFVSNNSAAITGVGAPMLRRTDDGFRVTDVVGGDPPQFSALNTALRQWDGKSAFRSGFLENTAQEPPVFFEVQLFPIDDGSGEYVGVASDVTQLEEREDAIRSALAQAQRGSESKTRFLANMSHDIRTPMNTIVNLTGFAIEERNDKGKLLEYLTTIRTSSDQLLMLINDILEMSRIESGRAELAEEPFDLRAELQRLADITAPLCAEKGQTFLCDFGGLLTAGVVGDRVKVSRILMNLLGNAVKFTPNHGAVRFIAADMPAMRPAYAFIRFTVEDNGVGIDEAFLPHVFDAFARADEKRVSGIQGTGLGLSICRSYVTEMGGQIRCASTPGEGSTFTVDLHFMKTDVAPARPVPAVRDEKPFAGLKCLVCEDVQINRMIAVAVLERLGFTAETADDGREALTMFLHAEPGHYDVVYMDIQMPVMDGYEATAAIRACEHADAKTAPIIAMTANVFIEDIEKAHIAGMDGHVGKPISADAIAAETMRVLQQKGRGL